MYRARETLRPGAPGRRGSLRVEILHEDDVIGSYERNYPALHRTFRPFVQEGREFALYSPHYTATRVMELPSCRDLGGEDPDPGGFCPVDYWVAQDSGLRADGTFGLVAGCVWGDDSSWKVQFVDLSAASRGQIVRDERFGYVELPDGMTLDEAVTLGVNESEDGDSLELWLRIRTELRFNVATGAPMQSSE